MRPLVRKAQFKSSPVTEPEPRLNPDWSQTGVPSPGGRHLVDVTWWTSVSPGNPDSRSPGLQDLGGFGRVEWLGVRLPAEGFYLPASLSKMTPDPHLNRSKMAALNTEDRTHSLIFVQVRSGNKYSFTKPPWFLYQALILTF